MLLPSSTTSSSARLVVKFQFACGKTRALPPHARTPAAPSPVRLRRSAIQSHGKRSTELAILLFGLEAPLVVGEWQREGERERESETSQIADCEQGSPGRKSRKTASSTETFHATPTRRCVAEFRGWNFLFSFPFCPALQRRGSSSTGSRRCPPTCCWPSHQCFRGPRVN